MRIIVQDNVFKWLKLSLDSRFGNICIRYYITDKFIDYFLSVSCGYNTLYTLPVELKNSKNYGGHYSGCYTVSIINLYIEWSIYVSPFFWTENGGRVPKVFVGFMVRNPKTLTQKGKSILLDSDDHFSSLIGVNNILFDLIKSVEK